MYCRDEAEYDAAKASAQHPDRFPDEDGWGYVPSFPVLICPHCGYRPYEGEEEAANHLADLFHTLFVRKKVVTESKWGKSEDWPVVAGFRGRSIEDSIRMACDFIKEPEN
jgi:hypothetical protein